MSLWKLRVGAEAYYLSQVASGLDDYYAGQGESVGRWVGNAGAGTGPCGPRACARRCRRQQHRWHS